MDKLKSFFSTAGISVWVAALICSMLYLQDVETFLEWDIVLYPLIGLIPSYMYLAFKGIVIDDKFNWKPFLYSTIGILTFCGSLALGVLFNHVSL